MHRTRHAKLIGFLFLAPALLFVLVFTLLPAPRDDLDLVPQLVADHAAQVRRTGNFAARLRATTSSGCRCCSASSTPCSSRRS